MFKYFDVLASFFIFSRVLTFTSTSGQPVRVSRSNFHRNPMHGCRVMSKTVKISKYGSRDPGTPLKWKSVKNYVERTIGWFFSWYGCRVMIQTVYACMYMHSVYAYIHICVYAYMHIYIYAYMHRCIYAYMHICIYAYMHICKTTINLWKLFKQNKKPQ